MDFIEDYCLYHNCYAIPRNYVYWSALSLIGATVHRKVYFNIGDIEVHAHNYVLLVGPMGNKKSTPCDFARGFFTIACPNALIGSSNQTVEDIVKTMSADDFARVYTNERDEKIECRPYTFFINEFKNFIAYNPPRSVAFLVDIYDRKVYDSGTIKRGKELIINPSINILACENPEPLVKFMKNDTVSGGMARRMIIVYETDYSTPIPRPIITPEAHAAKLRIITRATEASKIVGKFQESQSGMKFFDSWYMENHKAMVKEANLLRKGYLSTKDVHLRKTAMQIDAVSDKPMLTFTDDLLQHALSFLDAIEANMPKLSMAAGRNEMMPSQLKALELLREAGGWLPEKQLKREMESELSPMETQSVIRHLDDTEQVFIRDLELTTKEGNKVRKRMVILPAKYESMSNGELK